MKEKPGWLLTYFLAGLAAAFTAGCSGDDEYGFHEPGDPLKNLEQQSGISLPSSVTVVDHGTYTIDTVNPVLEPYWWDLHNNDSIDFEKLAAKEEGFFYSPPESFTPADLKKLSVHMFRYVPKMTPILSAKSIFWNHAPYEFHVFEVRTKDGCYANVQRVPPADPPN
jgi:hypothetical protein